MEPVSNGQDQAIDLSELEGILVLLPDGPIELPTEGGALFACC
jgi:hypothetical protein